MLLNSLLLPAVLGDAQEAAASRGRIYDETWVAYASGLATATVSNFALRKPGGANSTTLYNL
jgi:hypothetical protein